MRFFFTIILLGLLSQTAFAQDIYYSNDSISFVMDRLDKALEQHEANKRPVPKTYYHVIDGNTISIYLINKDYLFEAGKIVVPAIDLQKDNQAGRKLTALLKKGATHAGDIICHPTALNRTYVTWDSKTKNDDAVILVMDEFLENVVEKRQQTSLRAITKLPFEPSEPPVLLLASSFVNQANELGEQGHLLNVSVSRLDGLHKAKLNNLLTAVENLSRNIRKSLRERQDEWQSFDKAKPDINVITNMEKVADWADGYAENIRFNRNNEFASVYERQERKLLRNQKTLTGSHGHGDSAEWMAFSAYALTFTSNGGSAVAGITKINGTKQPMLLQFDEQNNLISHKTFDTKSASEFRAVHAVEDNKLLAILLDEDHDNNSTSHVVKYQDKFDLKPHPDFPATSSIYGKKIWQTEFPRVVLNTVVADGKGHYFAGGRTAPENVKDRDAVLIKLSTDGKVIWKKTFGGKANKDTISGILVLGNSLIVSGYGTRQNSAETHGFLAEIDAADGKMRWAKYPGKENAIYFQVIKTNDNKLAAVGSILGSEKNQAIVLKSDMQGNIIWDRLLLEKLTDYPSDAYSIASIGNDVIIAGAFADSALITRIDGDGKRVWEKTYGNDDNDDRFKAVRVRDNGDILVAGDTETYSSYFSSNILLLQFTADGELQ